MVDVFGQEAMFELLLTIIYVSTIHHVLITSPTSPAQPIDTSNTFAPINFHLSTTQYYCLLTHPS